MILFLVDDDPEDQEIFEMALAESEVAAQLVCFSSAHSVLEKLASLPHAEFPGFIFLDLNMPKINGLELLQLLSKHNYMQLSKIIIYSTSSNDKDITQAKSLGAHDYLIKPTNFGKLVCAIKQIIEGELA
ncbi:response regulator [Jiulongibacter sp. NS-SX5]|uniref:response regulator n=1 Tax=Jiulongibacter sp. NS-SX5 TaxID=3463854 RepID=UPI0040593E8D